MEYKIGISKSKTAQACVSEATSGFKHPKLILFFSPVELFEQCAILIHDKFPDSISMGASVIASFGKEGASKDALRVIGIENGICCSADMMEDINKYPIKHAERVERCVKQVGKNRNTICLEFTTALFCGEESVLSALNSVLFSHNIPVFGGTAGDSGNMAGTKVALNGIVKDCCTVFAIIHNEGGAIHFFRENIYTPATGNLLTATKTDTQTRTVMEYNSKPAAQMFAQELGVSEDQITKYFDTHPMGRLVGNDMFITANCALGKNHAITYHARIMDNAKVCVLKPDSYKEIIQDTMQQIKAKCPSPSLSIMCHCLARTLLFEGDGYLNEYARTMSSVLGNYIGFSGYGEQFGEQHLNQTMIVIVFE